MSDWSGPRKQIKALRKAARCHQCMVLISPGEPAIQQAGVYEDDFYSLHSHVDCDELSAWLAEAWDAWGECFPFLHDLDWDQLSEQERKTVKERWPRLYDVYLARYDEVAP